MRPDLEELRHLLANLRRMSPHLANTCDVLGVVIAEAEAGRKLREAIRCGYCVDELDECAACKALADYDAVTKGAE